MSKAETRSIQRDLEEQLKEMAERLNVPGVAVGVYQEGREDYVFHGITSIETPLPVDENTLFQFGSTGKTYTATAIMRLVELHKVKLEERVRTYLPDLKLKDEDVAREVTVLHLLNHTGGWQGDYFEDTGQGDDALAKFIELLIGIDQEFPLGKGFSYNNSGFSIAGRIIEVITGKTYEQAIKELLLEPLGLDNTFFFVNDIMTRRFVVGHDNHPDGTVTVARAWDQARSANPMGGMTSNAKDQIGWARFHLGDGKGVDGEQVLSRESLAMMMKPTVQADSGALGDFIGISWMLRDVEGVRIANHGGSTNGQQSAFVLVPERDFAIAVLTNASPNGIQLHQELLRWALEGYLGVVERDPVPEPRSDGDLEEYLGSYSTIRVAGHMTAKDGNLLFDLESRKSPDGDQGEDEDGYIDELPPFVLAMIPGGDRFIVTEGPFQNMKGSFTRDSSGAIDGIHFGGRLMLKQD